MVFPLLFARIARRVRRRRSEKKDHHIESSSGGPITDPSLTGDGAISAEKFPLIEVERFVCRDGVDAAKLLRAVRQFLYDKAKGNGADVLVEEQWTCTICGPRNRRDGSFRVSIQYSAFGARSELPDPQRPVALENVRSVPGLMTILSRDE